MDVEGGDLEDLEEHELDRATAARVDNLKKPRGGKAARYDDDEEVEEVEEPVNLREAFVGGNGACVSPKLNVSLPGPESTRGQ